MGRLSPKKSAEVLRAYFEEGMEPEEIAARMKLKSATVLAALSDEENLAPYRRRSEAAKLRAQICVNENAEEAARLQAGLLRAGEAQAVTQRAAKDILDRAGVRMGKGDTREVTIRFAQGMPTLGMPRRQEEDGWS